MRFEEYLHDKKIDSRAFQKQEPERWQELKEVFDLIHPNSFTVQKKFLINDLRRKFLLTEKTE